MGRASCNSLSVGAPVSASSEVVCWVESEGKEGKSENAKNERTIVPTTRSNPLARSSAI